MPFSSKTSLQIMYRGGESKENFNENESFERAGSRNLNILAKKKGSIRSLYQMALMEMSWQQPMKFLTSILDAKKGLQNFFQHQH